MVNCDLVVNKATKNPPLWRAVWLCLCCLLLVGELPDDTEYVPYVLYGIGQFFSWVELLNDHLVGGPSYKLLDVCLVVVEFDQDVMPRSWRFDWVNIKEFSLFKPGLHTVPGHITGECVWNTDQLCWSMYHPLYLPVV